MNDIARAVQQWVQSVIIDLNLCPFAKHEFINNRVRFSVTDATSDEQLLIALQDELKLLNDDLSIETTLLIHPQVLKNFYDYNQFLSCVDALLSELELEGVYQVASFHPDYQFAESGQNVAENYTNRSPYPLLHILREESLEQAIANYGDVEQIPVRNIAIMNSLGEEKMKALLHACFDIEHKDHVH